MKKLGLILPLALILCFMVGCQDKEAIAELEEFRAQAAVEEQNIQLFKSFYKAVESGDVEKMREYYSPETVYYSPSGNLNPMSGEENIKFTKMIMEAIPDISHNFEEIYAVDNKVIARGMIEGTQENELEGFPPPGNTFKVGAIYIFTIKDGKIIEMRDETDMLGMMMQLGFELKPKEGEK
ncbi:MAG: ester cyclase [Candidatus Aminicenantes bacterium]|jgi:steroid delta-isomerase-like uncharacterized protein